MKHHEGLGGGGERFQRPASKSSLLKKDVVVIEPQLPNDIVEAVANTRHPVLPGTESIGGLRGDVQQDKARILGEGDSSPGTTQETSPTDTAGTRPFKVFEHPKLPF